jgi:hypothetical protein
VRRVLRAAARARTRPDRRGRRHVATATCVTRRWTERDGRDVAPCEPGRRRRKRLRPLPWRELTEALTTVLAVQTARRVHASAVLALHRRCVWNPDGAPSVKDGAT